MSHTPLIVLFLAGLAVYSTSQEATQCVDNPEAKLQLRKGFSCNELKHIDASELEKSCSRNRQNVQTKCCATCRRIGFEAQNQNCEDDKDYRLELTTKVGCTEYATLQAETIEDRCKRNRRNVQIECCAICEQYLREECRVLTDCPTGITDSGPCSLQTLEFAENVLTLTKTMRVALIMKLRTDKVLTYSGDICISGQVAPLEDQQIESVRLIAYEGTDRSSNETVQIDVKRGSEPSVIQVTYPMKAKDTHMMVVFAITAAKPDHGVYEHNHFLNLAVRGCACASDQ